MLSSSKQLLEGLLYKVPSLLSVYKIIDLNNISSSEHKEYNNILSHFKTPQVIIAVGLTTSCFIIQREKKQTYHVIEIGAEAYYSKFTSGKLKKRIMEIAKQKDFIPEPLTRKIVVIGKYTKKEAFGDIYVAQTSTRYVATQPSKDGVYSVYKLNGLLQAFLKILPVVTSNKK